MPASGEAEGTIKEPGSAFGSGWGFYTIDAKEAAELVMELKPKTVIPMHYRQEQNACGYDVIGTVRAFTELMDSVTTVDGSEICMENRPEAQVVVLNPANWRR